MDLSSLLPATIAARQSSKFDPKQEEAYYRAHAGLPRAMPFVSHAWDRIRRYRPALPTLRQIVRIR